MTGNQIEIGITVDDDSLKAKLDAAAANVTATCQSIKDNLKTLRDQFVTFRQALEKDDGSSTWRKAEENSFAEQVAHVQELRTLNQISADEAIRWQKQIEDAKYETLKNETYDQKQLDELTTQHYAKLRQLDQKAISESMQAWQQMLTPISNAFSSSLTGMITGQQNFRQALANIGNAIVSDFVNMAVKRAPNWIAAELTMTQASAAGDAARAASHASADAAGKAAEAASGSATVFDDANKAASGAFSAVAGIPFVGPILAPVAAATAFAAVMAFDVFSARGGFDIPAGLNPVTQLHEREMVLPASIADPLRAGLAGGGRPAGGDIHIHAIDAASFQRLLMDNKSALARALRGAHRGFDPALA